jgi:hypothetical protein
MPGKNEKCLFCDRIWGVFGVALGGLILLIGMDLLSGGSISRMVGKPRYEDDIPEVETIDEAEYEDES